MTLRNQMHLNPRVLMNDFPPNDACQWQVIGETLLSSLILYQSCYFEAIFWTAILFIYFKILNYHNTLNVMGNKYN